MADEDENPYAGYLVGIVVSCEPVPNKDSLFQLKVDVGGAEDLQIVTNAVNANAGKRVVVATVGSKVRLDGGEMDVKKATVGGVPSEGMLCDPPMLGWVGGGAGNAALVPDTCAVGSAPPLKRPRMDGGGQEEAKDAGPEKPMQMMFEKKLTKEEKKALREAKKAAKA